MINLGFIIFASGFALMSAVAHIYLWQSLQKIFTAKKPNSLWIKFLLVLGTFAGPVALNSFYFTGKGAFFVVLSLTWVGIAYILVGTLIPIHIVGWVMNRPPATVDLQKRNLLIRILNWGSLVAAAGTSGFALTEAIRTPRIKEVQVKLKNWPRSLNGFTIAQISDLHIGAAIHKEYVQKVVELTNSIGADLIALTGDIVDGKVERLRESSIYLKDLNSRHGTFFVTGNHEYYSGVHQWLAEFQSYGIRVLRNETVAIHGGDDFFNLAGIDDYKARSREPDHGPDLTTALLSGDSSRPTVLLAHQPLAFTEAVDKKVALQISGHTHGGQVFPFGFVVALVQPFVQGLHYVQDSCIYVSCGTGFWGPALRLAAPSEITKIVISSQSEA